MSQLPANVLFSPSLARAHIAQAKDWNYIDAWLLRHLSKPPPPFERNAETLKSLLALAAHNEAADDERALLARVDEKTLQELKQKSDTDPNKELLETLESNLTRDGQLALDTLADLSIVIKMPVPAVERMGKKIVDIQAEIFELDQASHRVSVLETHLKEELANINNIVRELEGSAYHLPPELVKQTSDYQRKTKALASKMPELRDRVAAMQADAGKDSVTIEDVKAQEDRHRDLTATVKDLEARVKGFHGLPQDTDLARLELEGLRIELRDLTIDRERMFEGLVERESPRKAR